MKNKLFIFLILLFLFITPVKSNNIKNLLIIYMASDNDLYEHALGDILEIENSIIKNAKVLILLDGNNETKIVEIDNETKKILKIYDNLNTGDPEVLTNFILFSLNLYNPKNIILALWGHGDGRNFKGTEGKGVCFDENSLDYLTIKEIKESLKEVYDKKKRIINIIIFDACFMQTVEVSYELKDYVEYIIASQAYVPLDGFPYDDILNIISNENLSILDIGKEITKSYFDSYNNGSQGIEDVSISLLKASKSLEILMLTKEFVTTNKKIENIKNLRANHLIPLNQKYVDYYSFFYNLLDKEKLNLLDNIMKEYVLLNLNSFSNNLYGFSIYFPPYYFPINLTFFTESGWENFLWREFTF
ncbi:MAG: clostripain-related cysteine peptidase [Caldisericia bacterium]